SICVVICDGTGYRDISVYCRLAPEHLHTAQVEYARAFFCHASSVYAFPIILGGDSDGGNLAAAVAWATRGQALAPAAQVLIYPALGADTSKGTFISHAHAPMLTTSDMLYYDDLRSGGTSPVDNPLFTPL